MKERPILFSGPMVRAVLDGRKTQTRRPVTSLRHPYGHLLEPEGVAREFNAKTESIRCPLGQPGDRLWVRETWRRQHGTPVEYRATTSASMEYIAPWRPSIHMPRWASRITLEIARVWVERVQDTTPDDCRAEGQLAENNDIGVRYGFGSLWQSIYGTWDANPFVWAVEFRRAK